MSNVKFKYLGDTSKAYTNVITVVSYLYKLEDIYYINFGYSFSNKKDKYNKTLGKLKALENKKYTVEIGRCKPNFLQIDDIIFKHILLDEVSPSWVNKIINIQIEKDKHNTLVKEALRILDFAKNSVNKLMRK